MSSTVTTILDFSQQFAIYSYFLIFVFGLIGNISNILVFTFVKAFRRNPCGFYLITLSLLDCGLLLFALPFRLAQLVFNYDMTRPPLFWCKLRGWIAFTLQFVSLSTTCFAAIDQYLSTNHNHRLKQLNTLKLAYRLTYSAMVIWSIYDCLFLIFFDLRASAGCAIYNIYFARYQSYFNFIVLTGILPITVSSLFSALAYLNVRRIIRLQIPIIRRKLERQLTAMILTKVAFFVAMNCPYIIFRIYITNAAISPSDSLRLAINQLISNISYVFYYANNAVCSFT